MKNEKQTPKFKVGDQIIINEKGDSLYLITKTGSIGIIEHITPYFDYFVYNIHFIKKTGLKDSDCVFDIYEEDSMEFATKLDKVLA